MRLDAREVPGGSVLETDICIAGAGPAAVSVAGELAGSSARVLILESGGESPGARGSNLLSKGAVSGEPMFPLGQIRVRGLGGSANHWQALDSDPILGGGMRAARLEAIDFEQRDCVPYSGWPFDARHLQPFYERAEELLEIRPGAYAVEDWLDRPGVMSRWRRTKPVILQLCHPGVVLRAARRVSEAGNVTLITGATVLRLEFDEGGRGVVSALVAAGSDRRFRVRAAKYVVAGGGIENARLLLLSVLSGAGGFRNDNIGRFFMEHPAINTPPLRLAAATDFQPTVRDGRWYVPALLIPEDTLRNEGMVNTSFIVRPVPAALATSGGASLAGLFHAYKTRRLTRGSIANLARTLKAPHQATRAAHGYLRNRWPGHGLFSFVVKVEQTPNPESRVVLSNKLDELGQPQAELRWRLTSSDREAYTRALSIMQAELAAQGQPGFLKILPELEPIPWPSYHQIGTTRMSPDPSEGVVDADCRVHGLGNVYVAGSSVFPTGGQANPTLTVMALALRLADHLKGAMRPIPA